MVQLTWEYKYLLNILFSFPLESFTFRLILSTFKYCQLNGKKFLKCCVSQTKHVLGLDPVTTSVKNLSNNHIKGGWGVEPGEELLCQRKCEGTTKSKERGGGLGWGVEQW